MNAVTRAAAQDMIDYIDAAPTPFHAVAETRRRLEGAGFSELMEGDAWSLAVGARHYVIRNETTIAAFIVGNEEAAEAGFRVVGAHTDSPNLRLKPRPDYEREGYQQLGVEIYGGVLLSTWFDRDLGIAGRVVVGGANGQRSILVKSERALARVPQLAIHLGRKANDEGVGNRQVVMPPIVGLSGGEVDFPAWLKGQVQLEGGEEILAFELMLHTIEPSGFSGLNEEFVHAPRLDNLASCHAALVALLAKADVATATTRMLVFYDHEEVGSSSAQGAASSFLADVMRRVTCVQGGGTEAECRARAKTFHLSADMAHAVHPNYAAKHDPHHKPAINQGPCIKYNANARYATEADSAAFFKRLAAEAGVPVQEFVMRTDMPCGSTIGPIIAARLGIKTVDIGNPMLSMHSCREMAGRDDQAAMIKILERFFA
ncbi:MAG: M18 family aminopeptidase [Planctomycetota bacterium]